MGEEKSVSVTFRLPKQLNDGLEEYVDKLGQSKTALLVEAVAGLLLLFKREGR